MKISPLLRKCFFHSHNRLGGRIVLDCVITICLFGLFFATEAFTAEFSANWAHVVESEISSNWNGIAYDSSGNLYAVGDFKNPEDLSPATTTFRKVSYNGNDILIKKFDNKGNLVWVRTIHTFGDGTARDIAIDTEGNILVLAEFYDRAMMPTEMGNVLFKSKGRIDILLLKLTPSGRLRDFRQFGGTSSYRAESMAIDAHDNVYISGEFRGNVFNEKDTEDWDSPEPQPVKGFVAKLDSSGNLSWVNSVQTTTAFNKGSIDVDSASNALFCGVVNKGMWFDFGGEELRFSEGKYPSGIVQKVSSTGKVLFYAAFLAPDGVNQMRTSVDSADNFYVLCNFHRELTVLTSMNEQMTFQPARRYGLVIIRFSPDGKIGWTRAIDLDHSVIDISSAVNERDNLYIAGGFKKTLEASTIRGPQRLVAKSGYDSFIASFDTHGVPRRLQSFPVDSFWNGIRDIAFNHNQVVTVAGHFDGILELKGHRKRIKLDAGINRRSFIVSFSEVQR